MRGESLSGPRARGKGEHPSALQPRASGAIGGSLHRAKAAGMKKVQLLSRTALPVLVGAPAAPVGSAGSRHRAKAGGMKNLQLLSRTALPLLLCAPAAAAAQESPASSP